MKEATVASSAPRDRPGGMRTDVATQMLLCDVGVAGRSSLAENAQKDLQKLPNCVGAGAT